MSAASETTIAEFTVPGLPVPFTRMVRGDQSKRAAEYRAYKELVGRKAREASTLYIADGPVILVVQVYMPDRMKRRWDADNVLKGISDALNSVIYKDDRQVTSATVRVYSLGLFMGRDETEVKVWVSKST